MVGSLSPNFLTFDETTFSPLEASASFDESSPSSMLLSIDGFLTKNYIPTEESKGASGIFTVKIEPGDTLSGIAARYGVSVRDIIINNNLPQNPVLTIGEKLSIANGIIHQVGKQDTAQSIAKAYGIDTDRLLSANELSEKDLKSGMKIVVVGAKRVLPTFASPSPAAQRVATAVDKAIAQSLGGKLFFPTVGKYTQFFRAGHYAVDIGNVQSPEIMAAEGGVIEKAQCGWNGGYGCYVIIQHGDGLKTLYAHMRKIYITSGEQVARGQVIGQMGNTGKVHGPTGIHLHFEVIVNGVKRNPLAFF